MIVVMSSETPERPTTLPLKWDLEAGAGYLAFTPIGAGEAVSQRIVENSVTSVFTSGTNPAARHHASVRVRSRTSGCLSGDP